MRTYYKKIFKRKDKNPGRYDVLIPDSCDEESFINNSCPCNLTETRVVLCDRSNLREFPGNLSDGVKKILLNNSFIENLEHVKWPRALVSLGVIHNQIARITRQTFVGAHNLTRLYLSHNNIAHIDANAFDHLRQLVTLKLESNKLTELAPKLIADKPALRYIHLDENQLDLDPEMRFSLAPNVEEIFLDHNRITTIRRHHFSNMSRLIWLTLANNRISSIEINSFEYNYDLQELNLSFNRIQVIDRRIFAHRLNIQRLLLNANPIETLPVDAFRELLELSSLDLTQIEFKTMERKTFSYLRMLKFIYFEKFAYCYYASQVRVCRPLTDGLSTFEELLAFPILKYAVWIVALVCSLGNITVLIWRTISKHEDRTLSLFVKNLSVADLMMGIYLCTIAWQDHRFQHKFREHADKWMSSWECTAIGFLAILSSELSVFLLTIITIERYRAIVSIKRFEEETFMRRARLSIALAWLFSFLIALYPLLEWLLQDSSAYYATNGLCLPLHIDQPYGRGWQYSAFVYLGINFSAVILMISLYGHMYMIIIDGHQTARPHLLGGEKRQDAILAIRFFFIVVTDCLCWIPIVVIKIIALRLNISSSIYGWLVVFIIPINSALNPIVYTLANPSTLFCRLLGRLYQRLDATCERIDRRLASRNGATSGTGGVGANGRGQRAPRGSNYSSSRSSTSISAGSEAQLLGQVASGRRRTKMGSSSTSTCCEHFESSVLTQSKGSSKSSFESTLLPTLDSPSSYNLVEHHQQHLQQQQKFRQHLVQLPNSNKQQQHLLNVDLDLAELSASSTKVELTLMSCDRELSLSGPSTGTGSSVEQESPTLDREGPINRRRQVSLHTHQFGDNITLVNNSSEDGSGGGGQPERGGDLLITLDDQPQQIVAVVSSPSSPGQSEC